MTLLEEIQSALIADGPLSPIILKLRLLGARLGVPALGDWIRHESDGYPEETAVPQYRKIPVSYIASFAGPLGGLRLITKRYRPLRLQISLARSGTKLIIVTV
jgi:hypothetical protein